MYSGFAIVKGHLNSEAEHGSCWIVAAFGIQAIGIGGDVRKKEDCVRAVETVVKELGRLDILINGAAGNFLTAAEDLSPNGFRTGKRPCLSAEVVFTVCLLIPF